MALKLLPVLISALTIASCSTPQRSYVTHPPAGSIVGTPCGAP